MNSEYERLSARENELNAELTNTWNQFYAQMPMDEWIGKYNGVIEQSMKDVGISREQARRLVMEHIHAHEASVGQRLKALRAELRRTAEIRRAAVSLPAGIRPQEPLAAHPSTQRSPVPKL